MLITADIMDWLNLASRYNYKQEYFHALFCDPPYHLTSITKRFGKKGSAPAKYGSDGAFARASKGFMGQEWDGGDLAFHPELWAGLKETLMPGAFCFAFAGSRGWHRMAVAIEDAGFIIHPTIFLYAFGSGFPKATRVKDNGKELERFEGHRYGLQSLKPAAEVILCFQKPYEGRPVDNIVENGAGALNIDAGRIRTTEDLIRNCIGLASAEHEGWKRPWHNDAEKKEWGSSSGRWPSNLILQHTPECRYQADQWQCVERCAVKTLGESQGLKTSGKTMVRKETTTGHQGNVYGQESRGPDPVDWYGDTGTVDRYFYQSHWAYEVFEQINRADPLFYTTKVSSKERNAGLDSMPTKMQHRVNSGGLENEERWQPKPTKNDHPTLKPIALTKYLAGLLLPPDSYQPRKILVPFAGAGSEVIGALLTGWDEIMGIEMSQDYVATAQARNDWWARWLEWGQTDVETILASISDDTVLDTQGNEYRQLGF